MDELFAAVREECSSAEWSRGVELSRQDAVTLLRKTPDEVELRVTLKGGMSSALVTLYPEDEDWSCDCAKQEMALSLVAAAVIALRKAKKEGHDLSAKARDAGHVRYDLTRIDRGLKLEGVVVVGKTERKVGSSLMLLAKQLDGEGHVVITPDDLELERMLAGRSFEPLRYTAMHFRHVELGAKMMPAGAWMRPEYYGAPRNRAANIAAEALNVRENVGLLGSPPFEIPRMVNRDKELLGLISDQERRRRLPPLSYRQLHERYVLKCRDRRRSCSQR